MPLGVKRGVISTKTKLNAVEKSKKSPFFWKLAVELGANKTSVKYWKEL